MSEILQGDPYQLGFSGYTRDEGESIIAGTQWRAGDNAKCIRRGVSLRIDKCDLCGIKGQSFEVFACQAHGECSEAKRHSKVRSCLSCQDYTKDWPYPRTIERRPELRRNLIMHVYPRRCGKWRRAVAHLLGRWDQFNGRKIVSIATDETTDDPSEVVAAFSDAEIEYRILENSKGLQEVASFQSMLESVQSRDPNEITLYCHGKGATHEEGGNEASHLWLDAMAAACLDYPALVDSVLREKEICGAFRSLGLWPFPGYHSWHFAGTWFWFRHNAAFGRRDWRNIHPNFMGVEAWPGVFPQDAGGCLLFDRADTAHLYSVPFWRDRIIPALRLFHWDMEAYGLTPVCIDPPNHAEIAEALCTTTA